jgi:hypothetical protein
MAKVKKITNAEVEDYFRTYGNPITQIDEKNIIDKLQSNLILFYKVLNKSLKIYIGGLSPVEKKIISDFFIKYFKLFVEKEKSDLDECFGSDKYKKGKENRQMFMDLLSNFTQTVFRQLEFNDAINLVNYFADEQIGIAFYLQYYLLIAEQGETVFRNKKIEEKLFSKNKKETDSLFDMKNWQSVYIQNYFLRTPLENEKLYELQNSLLELLTKNKSIFTLNWLFKFINSSFSKTRDLIIINKINEHTEEVLKSICLKDQKETEEFFLTIKNFVNCDNAEKIFDFIVKNKNNSSYDILIEEFIKNSKEYKHFKNKIKNYLLAEKDIKNCVSFAIRQNNLIWSELETFLLENDISKYAEEFLKYTDALYLKNMRMLPDNFKDLLYDVIKNKEILTNHSEAFCNLVASYFENYSYSQNGSNNDLEFREFLTEHTFNAYSNNQSKLKELLRIIKSICMTRSYTYKSDFVPQKYREKLEEVFSTDRMVALDYSISFSIRFQKAEPLINSVNDVTKESYRVHLNNIFQNIKNMKESYLKRLVSKRNHIAKNFFIF